MPRWPDLSRTAAALLDYDVRGPVREALWTELDEGRRTWPEVEAALDLDWKRVTDAFALDTADRNQPSHAALVGERTMREFVRKWCAEAGHVQPESPTLVNVTMSYPRCWAPNVWLSKGGGLLVPFEVVA